MNSYGSRRWRALVCATTLVVTITAVAAPPPVPPPPVPQQPLPATPRSPAGTKEGHDGSRVFFGWSHVFSVHPPSVPNPRPRYFLICLHDAIANGCTQNPFGWWLEENAHRWNPIFRGVPQQIGGYEYLLELPGGLTSDALDRQTHWTVAACAGTRMESCAPATKLGVRFSSKDLRAENISDPGTSTSELIAVPALVWVDTGNPENVRCETNVDVVGVDRALTKRGVELDLNGPVDASQHEIVAVYRSDAPAISASNPFSGIPPGAVGTSVDLELPNPTWVAAWAIRLRVDTANAIAEFDETNNGYGECKLIY